MTTDRRAFLGTVAATSVTLAGCIGNLTGGGSSSSSTGELDFDHAATRGIDDEPRLGPAPEEAQASMIAYDGPACTECHTYDKETFPQIKSDLIDTGKLAYIGRLAPEYDWGKKASNALEATAARERSLYWDLLNFYLEDQSTFDVDNVMPRTEEFLNQETDLDGAAVVADAKDKKYRDAIDEDKQAWKDAGGNQRPYFFIYKDGNFVSEIGGPQGYTTIKSALGL